MVDKSMADREDQPYLASLFDMPIQLLLHRLLSCPHAFFFIY